jgi:hypothetical protein
MTYPTTSRRLTVARFVAGYMVVAAALPYLTLKLAWQTGHTIGLNDPALFHDGAMFALNLFTAGMDAVAVLVALTLTHRWGARVPAWLVLLPMWVGTGFLAPIVIVGPFAAAYAAFAGGSVVAGDAPVEPWVYGIVYTGFVCEGLGLLAAFVLYARTRWPAAFRTRVGESSPGATHRLQVLIARPAAILAVLMAAFHLAWALDVSAGLPAAVLANRSAIPRMVDGLLGALALIAAFGVLMLLRPDGRARTWVPLILTWVGAASLFAWGGWVLLAVLSASPLERGAERPAMLNLVALGETLAGLLIATVAAFALTERDERSRFPATDPATPSEARADREIAHA